MQSFISETLDVILKTQNVFTDTIFILPSQRAKVFVKQAFKDKITVGFLPEIVSIEEFIHQVSEVHQVDTIQLLFHFYTVYKDVENNADPFDVFSSWATTVLQDFNEIDQHLIDTKDIFLYIRDIERLRKWSVKGTFKETDLIKNHNSFLEKLQVYYKAFYSFLKDKQIGYQGLLYREACKKIDEYLNKKNSHNFYFIGFNALNKAEEFLFQKVLETERAEIFWDIDATFLENNHNAGRFIRTYLQTWKYYEKHKINNLSTFFSTPKHIEIIGAAKNTTQIKYVGEILRKSTHFKDTALVLADETLLPITLSSLPENVDSINITMGYPLKDTPLTHLFFSIFQLFLTKEKLQKDTFYYKDVIQFLKHQNIYTLLPQVDDFCADLAKNNITFVNKDFIKSFFKSIDNDLVNSILSVFTSFNSIDDFLQKIINLINILKENTDSLEKEYLFRFYTIFSQLQVFQSSYQYLSDLKTVSQFFKQIINLENLSFQGEPLKGLQLMGMLETRVLDFETVILTSVNEGVLPANAQKNSFIPFDVKVQFGLPTYREKDAIFAYHFFRLLQRAKNIFILYNTENDDFGSGEKSRFITQLEMMNLPLQQKIISPKVISEKPELIEIPKNELLFQRLREIAKEGFSPSSITNYLRNPITFYKQKVLKIKEIEDIEETVAANTLGNIVHKTLDDLYKPFEDKFLSIDDIKQMEKEFPKLIDNYFKIEFKNGDISTGKNRLIFEVANRFVYNFLNQEKELLTDSNNRLKIIATEKKLETVINIDGLNFPIKIHGNVDRIDELNGEIRIIDYKTGKVERKNLNASDFSRLRDKDYHKAVQVLLYALLYNKTTNFDFSKPIKAGVISFKNLNQGFLGVNFSSNYRSKDEVITKEKLDDFLLEFNEYMKEIYNPTLHFVEAEDVSY